MSIRDSLVNGIKVLDKVIDSLKSTVSYEQCTASDSRGKRTYGSAVSLKAAVDWSAAQVRTREGILTVSRARIIFTDIPSLVTATGGLGIDDKDKITLQDGTTGPILDLRGYIDPGTGQPVATEVLLG